MGCPQSMGKTKMIIKRIIITNHYKALNNIALLIKINILKEGTEDQDNANKC